MCLDCECPDEMHLSSQTTPGLWYGCRCGADMVAVVHKWNAIYRYILVRAQHNVNFKFVVVIIIG